MAEPRTPLKYSNLLAVAAVTVAIVIAGVVLNSTDNHFAHGAISQQAKPTVFDTAAHYRIVDSLMGVYERRLKSTNEPIEEHELALIDAPLLGAETLRLAAIQKESSKRMGVRVARNMKELRRQYAPLFENHLLDDRIDAKVSVTGENLTTLKIEYLLAGRVFAHDMQKNDSLFAEWKNLGFHRTELIGYSFATAWEY